MAKAYLALFLCLISFALYSQESATPSGCSDGIDNDGNGFVDCFDSSCSGNSACDEAYVGKNVSCQDPPDASLLFGMQLAASSKNRSTLSYGRFVVGDLDRDGVPEVVTVHRDDKKAFILNGTDLSVKKEWSTVGLPEYYDHAIANLDNDNCAEIFLVEESSSKFYVVSYDCNGVERWRTQAAGQPFTLSLADLDHDGKVEIYYKNEILDAHTGTRLVKGSGTDWNSLDAGPVAVDMFADDKCTECQGLEIVLGGRILSVDLNPRTLDGGAVTTIKNINDAPTSAGYFPKFTGFGYVNSQTSIADFDEDGALDVIMNGATSSSATSTTTVFFWNVDKGYVKKYQPKQSNGSSWAHGTGRINIADIDGDGVLNIMFVTGSRLFALKRDTITNDLSTKWIKSISEATSGFTSTTVFDFNNDNAVEIVYRDEKNIYIINGQNGNTFTSAVCRSRTANEYPIVVDVDGDGETEICVSCAFDDNVDINNTANTVFGHIRKYESSIDPWVSARKVWNQHGYFNVNVNDDLTIPRTQQKHHMVFSVNKCKTNSGAIIKGKNHALNSFLNQSAILDSAGCKTYASSNILFVANPDKLNVTAPTCPEKDFKVSFTLLNDGEFALNGTLPVTFYNGDPRVAGATKLNTANITMSNWQIGDSLEVNDVTVNGPGYDFMLYAVLNDNGSVAPPITLPNSGLTECDYLDNVEAIQIRSTPFSLGTSSTDHIQCGTGTSTPNGTTSAFALINGVQTTLGYTFKWFNNTTATGTPAYTGPTRTGVLNNTYSVFATHTTQGCSSDTVLVTVGATTRDISVSVTVDQNYTDCKNPDGKMTIVPADNAPIGKFTFEWYEGNLPGTSPVISTSHVLADVKDGAFSFIVKEKSTNCQTSGFANVLDETPEIEVDATVQSAVCVPVNSGSASATANTTTIGYTFEWYDGVVKGKEDHLGADYNSLSPGDYYVIAIENVTKCESDPFLVTITNDANVTVDAEETAKQTSCTSPNGIASVESPRPASEVKYEWFKGNNTLPANFIAEDDQITGLAIGDYTVKVTELATGCTDTELVTISEQIIKPTFPLAPATVNQTKCEPANGSATATATSTQPGAGPFTYYWFDGNIGTPDINAADEVAQTYSGLKAGSYTVVAVDNFTNCQTARALVTITDGSSKPAIVPVAQNQSSCDATVPNGAVTTSVTPAGGNYRYEWYSGSDTTTAPLPHTTANISGKAAGTYTVKIFDNTSGCTDAETVIIAEVSGKPVLTLSKGDNINCDASIGYTGFVTSSFSSNPNYVASHVLSYSWKKDGNQIDTNIEHESTLPGLSSPTPGLNAGSYSVIVTNETLNCKSDPVSIVVKDEVVLPTITTGMTASTNCATGTPNGSVTVTSVTPVDSYEYRWYEGTVAGVGAMRNPSVTDPTANGLQGGTNKNYIVEVKLLTTGCKNTKTVLLPDQSALPVLGALSKTDNTLCVGGNGTASLTTLSYKNALVASPYAGYVFEWSNGQTTPSTTLKLTAGTYKLKVTKTDVSCTSDEVSVTINDNLVKPVITAPATAATNCSGGAANGRIDVTAITPDIARTYRWLDPSNTPMTAFNNQTAATGLTGNLTYTVEVTLTSTQCKSTKAVLVPDESAKPVLGPLSKTDNTICTNGVGDGTATIGTVSYKSVLVPDPYAGYELMWTAGASATTIATTPGITAKVANTYSLRVKKTDVNCISDPVSVVINNNRTFPTINTTSQGSSACAGGTHDGSITITSPTTGITNVWKDFSGASIGFTNQLTATGLKGDSTYTMDVTITATGCVSTKSLKVQDISAKPVLGPLSSTENTICTNGVGNGTATIGTVTYKNVAVNSPYSGYQLIWSNAGSTPTISNLDDGVYNLRIRNIALNCTSDPVDVIVNNDSAIPVIENDLEGSTACASGTHNGKITITSPVAPTAFTSTWTNSVGATIATNQVSIDTLTANKTYEIEVMITATGCIGTKLVTVPDSSARPVLGPLSKTNNTFCVGGDGTASIGTVTYRGDAVASPFIGYALSWLPDGETDETITGKPAGTYSLTITKLGENCVSDPVEVTINDDSATPLIEADIEGSSACAGGTHNGKITITSPVMATTPFTNVWTDDTNATIATDQTFVGGLVSNETYEIELTVSATGCVGTKLLMVPDSSARPVLGPLSKTDNTICTPGIGDGTATIGTVTYKGDLVPSPYAGYSLSWTPDGETTETISLKTAGDYTLTITKTGDNCASDPVEVTILDDLETPAITTQVTGATNCAAADNGEIQITAVTPNVPYTNEWFDDTNASIFVNDDHITGLGADREYRVELEITATGCSVSKVIKVPNSKALPILGALIGHDNTLCVGTNGFAEVGTITYKGSAVPDPYNGYTFLWIETGETTSSTAPLVAGTYTLEVTKTDVDCTSDPVTVTIKDDPTFPEIEMDVTPQRSCDLAAASLNGQIDASVDEAGTSVTNGYNYFWYEGSDLSTPLNAANIDPTDDFKAIKLPGEVFYTLEVEHATTFCRNTRTVYLPQFLSKPRVELTVNPIVDCVTPGSIQANVFVDTDFDGAENALTTPAEYTGYVFTWKRDAVTLMNTTGRLLEDLDNGDPIPADDYFVSVINSNNCESDIVKTTLATPDPVFDIDTLVNFTPATCAVDLGAITAYVDEGGGVMNVDDYTFEWFAGSITSPIQDPPASFYTEPQVTFQMPVLDIDQHNVFNTGVYLPGALPSYQAPTSGTTGPTLYGRPSGTYTVVVTNSDGCKEHLTAYIPFQAEPVIIVAEVTPDDCAITNDGAVNVDVTIPLGKVASDYKVWLISGTNPTLVKQTDPAAFVDVENPATATNNLFANLPAGIYTIAAQEDVTNIASGCYSAPVQVEIRTALPPILNLSATTVNTTCGAVAGTGSLEIQFESDPSDPFNPAFPAPPHPTSYVVTPQTYTIDVDDSGGGSILAGDGPYASGGTKLISSLINDDYDVTITSSQGCTVTKTFTVPWNPAIPEILDSSDSVINATFCNPALETRAGVHIKSLNIVGSGASTNMDLYHFEWFSDLALTTMVYNDDGEAAKAVFGGEVYQNGKNAVANGTVLAGSYWVVATNNEVGHANEGCASAPFKVIIEDDSEDPTVEFITQNDRSCNLADFDGEIQVIAGNTSVPTLGYNFNWTSIPGTSTIMTGGNTANPYTTDIVSGDNIGAGSYDITVTNRDTGCDTDATVTIDNTELQLSIEAEVVRDIKMCIADGEMRVTDIFEDESETPGDLTEYSYIWEIGAAGSGALQDSQMPLENIDEFTIVGGTDDGEYAGMTATASYFVSAEKQTLPGKGCVTPPARVDIMDLHEDPRITFAVVNDRSCNPAAMQFDGQITVVASNTTTPTGGYDFAWTSIQPGSTIVTAGNFADTLATDPLTDIIGAGTYVVEVTNDDTKCVNDATVTVDNTALALTLTAQVVRDREVCFGDGELEVVSVSVGDKDAEYIYAWREDALTNPILQDLLNDPIEIPKLIGGTDATEYEDLAMQMTGVPYVYFVTGEKTSKPGFGCSTTPVRLEMMDLSEKPAITFAVVNDRSCNQTMAPLQFDGQITVVASNTTTPTGGYDFAWTSIEPGSTIVTAGNFADTLATDPLTDIIGAGTYVVEVTNDDTKCVNDATVTVDNTALALTLTAQVVRDREVCFGDGELEVVSVSVGDKDVEYTYEWREDAITNPILQDPENDPIEIPKLIGGDDDTEYEDLAMQITGAPYLYFVTGTKESKPGFGCSTTPVRLEMMDLSKKPAITFAVVNDRSCDPGATQFDGQITVSATNFPPPVAGYTYTWTSVEPQNTIGVPTGSFASSFSTTGTDNIGEGNYVIEIRNETTLCDNTATVTVENTKLAVSLNAGVVSHRDVCFSDGEMAVTSVSSATIANYSYTWTKGLSNTALLDAIAPDQIITSNIVGGFLEDQYDDMTASDYFVSGTKGNKPGFGCVTPKAKVSLMDLSEKPKVSFAVTNDRSCNLTDFDGVIAVTVQNASVNGYSFAWNTPFPTGSNIANPPNDVAAPFVYTSTAADLIGKGNYQIRVTNLTTQCFQDAPVEVLNNKLNVSAIASKIEDRDVCFSDGRIDVTSVTPVGGTYTYAWRKTTSTSGVLSDNSPAVITGASLIGGRGVAQFGSMTADAYFATATKTNKPGMGCSSAPARADINDLSQRPAVTFAVVNDQSCDGSTFDGSVEVSSTTTGYPSTTNYRFDWTLASLGEVTGTSPQSTAGMGEGTYQITVTNQVSECLTVADVSVENSPMSISLAAAKIADRDVCFTDGEINVTSVSPGAFVNYNFEWRKASITGGLLNDSFNNNIIGTVLRGGMLAGEYDTLDANAYYVTGIRNATPGMGCPSATVKVDIVDISEKPVVSFTTIPNTSCDPSTLFDGAVTVSATTPGYAVTTIYDFDWAVQGLTTGTSPQTLTAQDSDEYGITVTNTESLCATDATVTIIQSDPVIEILSVDIQNRTDCLPINGGAFVDALNAAHVSVTGTYTFSWLENGAPMDPTPSPDHTITGKVAGLYHVTGQKQNAPGAGCTTMPFPVNILDETELPAIGLTATANTACNLALANGTIGAVVFEPVLPVTDGYDFTWYTGTNTTGTPLADPTPDNFYSNRAPGNYTVHARDLSSPSLGCENVATIEVEDESEATTFSLQMDVTPQTFCEPINGEVEVVRVIETVAGDATPNIYEGASLSDLTFQWFDSLGTDITPAGTQPIVELTGMPAGTYYAVVTNELGCASIRDSDQAIENETNPPVITLVGFQNPQICVLPEVLGYISVSAGDGNYSYEWFIGDRVQTDPMDEDADLTDILAAAPDQYTVNVTDLTSQCASFETYAVETIANPIDVVASAVDLTYCSADNGELFGAVLGSTAGLFEYIWFEGDEITDPEYDRGQKIENVGVGKYTVIAIDPTHPECESIPDTISVLDKRIFPSLDVEQLHARTTCDPVAPNGAASASVDGEIIGYRFDWFGEVVSTDTLYINTHEVDGLTNINYIVHATDVLTGCLTEGGLDIQNKPLNVPEPDVEVLSHLINCVDPDGALAASVNGITVGYIFSWYDDEEVSDPESPDNIGETYIRLDKGLYAVTAYDEASGCVSDPVVEEILPFQETPQFRIFTTNTACRVFEGDKGTGTVEIEFPEDIEIASIVYRYSPTFLEEDELLNLPDTFATGIRMSDLDAGYYSVDVLSAKKCRNVDFFQIIPDIVIFNGVSNNGDGQNDFFEIPCIEDFPNNNVKIFNRAGTLVYENNGYNNQDVIFDGVSNRGLSVLGTSLPEGTYFYIIDKGDGTPPKSGYLELLR